MMTQNKLPKNKVKGDFQVQLLNLSKMATSIVIGLKDTRVALDRY